MKANRLMRKGLAHLLPVVMIVSIMMAGLVLFGPLKAEEAHAAYTASPASITELDPEFTDDKISTAHEVTFAGKKWLVVGYDGVGDPYSEGDTKITLLANETLIDNTKYADRTNPDILSFPEPSYISNFYRLSRLRSILDEYIDDTSNFTAPDKEVIVSRTLKAGSNIGNSDTDTIAGSDVNAKLWPLSAHEASLLSPNVLEWTGKWWLRSPGSNGNMMTNVEEGNNVWGVNSNGANVWKNDPDYDPVYAVRPALQLDLDLIECTFDDEEITITPQGPVKSVSLDPEASTIAVGETLTLTPTVVFNDTSDQTLIWNKMGTGIKLYTDAACTNELVLEKPVSNTPVYAQGVSVFQTNCVFVSANANRGKLAACTIDVEKAVQQVAVPSGKVFTYNGNAQTGVVSGASYTISGTASAVNAGSYEATATLKTDDNITYTWSDGTVEPKNITWQINKAGNSLSVSGKTATIKAKKVKKKNQKIAAGKVLSFRNGGQGARVYAKLSGNKKITINKTTGQVTVKKKLKKGTYKVKVKVMAAGNQNYNASAWTQVTFKIKIK